jgi:hypothetical protein
LTYTNRCNGKNYIFWYEEILFQIYEKSSLYFEADSLTDHRKSETFEKKGCSEELRSVAMNLYERTRDILPERLRPKGITIHLEYDARVQLDSGKIKEEIPLSLITSMQVPSKSEIRMGMLELTNDVAAFKSILAHELGHMIIEWPARINGLANDRDAVIPFWTKSIYEGVADFYSVFITGSRIIGSRDLWFKRSIDDYRNFEHALESGSGTFDTVIKELSAMGLLKHESYKHWTNLVKGFVKNMGEDPYNAGTVLARQLIDLSDEIGGEAVVDRIVELALTGKEFQDPKKFLKEIENR